MKTTLIFVSSLDGKVTKWGNSNVKSWTSHQDQDYYKKIWSTSRLIIMGSTTYNADPKTPLPNQHFVVMTRHPEKYKSIEVINRLEFTNQSPSKLIARFKKEGFSQALIAGGPHVATSFLKEELIDELWLTIEPKIFGIGENLAMEKKLDIHLRLISSKKVNKQGTLITKYAIVKK
jgi:dihydrofolate reductase